jgi:hypothetical protein
MPLPARPERIVWRRLDDGDYRKFVAESNDSPTGGGARDLRFRNWDVFEPVLGDMFPGRIAGKGPRHVEIFTGVLAWDEEGSVHREEAQIWPPTNSRPGEGRLATVYKYKPFAEAQRFPGEYELVILVQDSDQEVWPYIIGHTQLEAWEDGISNAILECLLHYDRPESTLAAGYIDLITGRRECVV